MKRATLAMTGLIALALFGTVACGSRAAIPEYSGHGQITTSGGVVLARSDPVDDQYSYQRVYPGGAVYADLTGYDSMHYGPTGLERDQNEILSGEESESTRRRERRAEHIALRSSRPHTRR